MVNPLLNISAGNIFSKIKWLGGNAYAGNGEYYYFKWNKLVDTATCA